jgi:HK97 gp10 family phage protein
MAESGIRVTGVNEAVRALRFLGAPSKEVGQASFEAGEIVSNRARTLVPVRTGKLRSSIKTFRERNKVKVRAGNEKSVPYANPIHWGWNYDKVRLQAKNIRPRPFFTNALSTTRQQVYKTYVDGLQALINKYSK